MRGEEPGGLVSAAQVPRVGLAETAEIDNAPDALAQGHPGERLGAGVLAGREVAARSSAHRVDQVVGDLDAAARLLERVGAQNVASWSSKPRRSRWRARDRSRTRQRTAQPASASACASRPPMNPVAPVTSARPAGARRRAKFAAPFGAALG